MTITYKGIEFEVEYDYQPGEPEVRYYPDGSGDPGCPESLDVTEINYQGEDFYSLLEDNIDDIEELILDQLHEYNGRQEP